VSNYILYPVLELRDYILATLAVLVALTLYVLFLMGRRRRGLGSFGWQGVFVGRTRRELMSMAIGISEMTFVVSMLLSQRSVGIVHLAALFVLCLSRGLLSLSPQALFGELVFGGLTAGGLMAANLLSDYISSAGTDWYMALVWGFLCLFLLQYSVYYFIKSLERMLRQHEKNRERHRADDSGEDGDG